MTHYTNKKELGFNHFYTIKFDSIYSSLVFWMSTASITYPYVIKCIEIKVVHIVINKLNQLRAIVKKIKKKI